MATYQEILGLVKEAKGLFLAGDFVAGGRKLLEVQSAFLDIAADLGFKSTPDAVSCKKEIEDCLKECHAICCNAPAESAPSAAVGKLGDGVLLKLLLEYLMKILPLVIK